MLKRGVKPESQQGDKPNANNCQGKEKSIRFQERSELSSFLNKFSHNWKILDSTYITGNLKEEFDILKNTLVCHLWVFFSTAETQTELQTNGHVLVSLYTLLVSGFTLQFCECTSELCMTFVRPVVITCTWYWLVYAYIWHRHVVILAGSLTTGMVEHAFNHSS